MKLHAPVSPSMRRQVQHRADTARTTMVIGWQHNDNTGCREIGFCPKAAVGSAFVYEVLETIEPSPEVQTAAMQETVARALGQDPAAKASARTRERERLCLQAKKELDAMVGSGLIGPHLADWVRPTLTPKLVAKHTNDGMSIVEIVDMQIELARLKQARDRKRYPPPKDSALAEVLADPSKLRAVVGAQLPELRPYRLRTSTKKGKRTFVFDHDMTLAEARVFLSLHMTEPGIDAFLASVLQGGHDLSIPAGDGYVAMFPAKGKGPPLTFIREAT